VLIIEGILSLDHQNDDYIMFFSGRNINLTDILDSMILEDVFIKVKRTHKGKVLFCKQGELFKEKVSRNYYLFYVGNQDLDSVLWDNVGQSLNIEIKNISNYNM